LFLWSRGLNSCLEKAQGRLDDFFSAILLIMRYSFENNIHEYNEVARDLEGGGLTPEEERNLARELGSKIRRVAKNRETTSESQLEIFELQQEKQRIMQKLKERISLLNDPLFVPPRRPEESLVVNEGGLYVVKSEENEADTTVTKGEIITDMEWGMYYYLDPATVDVKIRKRYLIEDAKSELMDRLNEQIEIDEISSKKTTSHIKEAYSKKAESSDRQFGFIHDVR